MVQICVKNLFELLKMCKYASNLELFAVLTRCLFLPRNLTAALPCFVVTGSISFAFEPIIILLLELSLISLLRLSPKSLRTFRGPRYRTVISPPDSHSIIKVRVKAYEPLTSLRGISVPKCSFEF